MKRYIIIICSLTLLFPDVKAQDVQQDLPEKTRILFLLDGSGSMMAPWGKERRIDAAKVLLAELVDSLKINPDVELGLRVYGHQFPSRVKNCTDTKLEVGFSKGNHQTIINKLRAINPQGTTPLSYSLSQAANDFPKETSVRNIIIIITDGIESCDGDPCTISQDLQKNGVFLRPFIIGLGLDTKFKDNFDCLGRFLEAENRKKLKNRLSEALKETLGEATLSVQLINAEDQPIETNVNISFINQATQNAEFDFIHYLDSNNQPDSVKVDPVITYDLLVNTIPPVTFRNVNVPGESHLNVKINTPQGLLKIDLPNHHEYTNGVNAIIKQNNRTVHVQSIPSEEKYIEGTYDLEILTLPRIYLREVKINGNNTKELQLDMPGLVNLYFSAKGYASIYQMNDTGQQRWIKNVDAMRKNHSFAIQPGTYKVVFRAERAMGSKYTLIKTFTISSGQTKTVNIASY